VVADRVQGNLEEPPAPAGLALVHPCTEGWARAAARAKHLHRWRTRTVEVMQCPNDQTVLQMTERQGIEIDYCPTCRGVWLDRGELDKIIERASALPPPEAATSEPRHDPRTEVASYRPGYSQAPAYPQYPASGRSPKSPDSPDDYYGRGYDPRYRDRKKRKSFLGDLFDL
jgi:Zn-finger nucleic acid-binding protein